jgi:hypothetical protein
LPENPFNDRHRKRKERWNKLLGTAFDADEEARALTALFNLDWGHQANASQVPPAYLRLGCEVVWKCLIEVRPRIIIAVTKNVFETFHEFLSSRTDSALTPLDPTQPKSFIFTIPGANFATLCARSPNHPSRHWLTASMIESVKARIRCFLANPEYVYGSGRSAAGGVTA